MQILFKNLEPSELAREITTERISAVTEKFPDLETHRIHVVLSVENTMSQPGPDHFTVSVRIQGSRYKNVILKRSAGNLYVALADVCDHLLEKLNRFGDKERVKSVNEARRFVGTQKRRA